MSKRRRAAPSEGVDRRAVSSRGQAHERTREPTLGNQATQSGLDAPAAEGHTPGLDVVRDVALPGLVHTQVALELRPMPAERLERLVEIVERSALEGGRRADMAERLRASQDTAVSVGRAVGRAFGVEDSAEVRSRATELLASVVSALESGSGEGATWSVGEHRVDVPETGSLRERADALVCGLGDAVSGREGEGRALASLCRSVQLAVLLDEEEEEGPTPGSYAEEESGW